MTVSLIQSVRSKDEMRRKEDGNNNNCSSSIGGTDHISTTITTTTFPFDTLFIRPPTLSDKHRERKREKELVHRCTFKYVALVK